MGELDSFEYVSPTEASIGKIQTIRGEAKKFRDMLKANIPHSRELSTAITKLEEVVMWANKGVVFTQE